MLQRTIFLTAIFFLVFHSLAMGQTNSGNNDPIDSGEEQPISITKEKTDAKDTDSPFSLYKDTYLLTGWSDSAYNEGLVFKFQISAKFQMPLPGLYIAYTQRSFMDVLKDSAPFYDHNFEPEVYYVHSFSKKFMEKNWLKSIQFGYRHESNGLDGTNSRSWERLYVEAEFKKVGWSFRTTLWYPFYEEEENEDVEDYYGYGEFSMAHVWSNDIRLSGIFRKGMSGWNGNLKSDFTVPFRTIFTTLPKGWSQSNIWLQVWYGYGETFLGLHESSAAVAAGVGFRPDFDL